MSSQRVTVLLEKTAKNWKISWKSVTVFLKKSEKLKSVVKTHYGSFRKKVINWKMSSKSVTALPQKSEKLINVLKIRCPSKKKVKNVLKKYYSHSKKNKKLKNILENITALKKKWKTYKCSHKALQPL